MFVVPGTPRVAADQRNDVRAEEGTGGRVSSSGGAEGGQAEAGNLGEDEHLGHDELEKLA